LTHAWARPIPAAWVLTDSDDRAFEYAVLWAEASMREPTH
jgi:hypothetical protein